MRKVFSFLCVAMAMVAVTESFSMNRPVELQLRRSQTSHDNLYAKDASTLSPRWTQLHASSTTPEDEDSTGLLSSLGFDPAFATLYVAFLSYAFIFSPGAFFSDIDNAYIQSFIENPAIRPDNWNELFFLVWNLLGAMPLILSQLIFPQGCKKGLPAAPFCVASAAMGYFGLGPYLTFRSSPVESKTRSEMSWISGNVLENKIFNWIVVAIVLFSFVNSGIFGVNPSDLIQGYGEMASESKLVSVSSMDLSVLTIACALLIRKDLQLREPDIDDAKATLIAASSILLPIGGAAIYCALRPPLPEE